MEGMQLVYQKLQRVLALSDVRVIEVEPGVPFDPDFHQAVLSQESEEYAEGEIIAEAQKGYLHGERVLRPSMVVVSKGPGKEEVPEPETTVEDETDSEGGSA